MIRLYYNEADGLPLYTVQSDTSLSESNPWIELPSEPDNLRAYRVVGEKLVLTDLAPLKRALHDRLLNKVKELREPLVTNLPGQDMIYLRKEEEAARFLADPEPDMADYLLLSAEVGITAPSAYELAQLWLNMSVLWRQTAAQLEGFRLGLSAQIDAAGTKEALDALSAIITPTEMVTAPTEPEPETVSELPVLDELRDLRWRSLNLADQRLQEAKQYYLTISPPLPTDEQYQQALIDDDAAVITLWELTMAVMEELDGLHQDAAITIENAETAEEINQAIADLQENMRKIL